MNTAYILCYNDKIEKVIVGGTPEQREGILEGTRQAHLEKLIRDLGTNDILVTSYNNIYYWYYQEVEVESL